MHFLQIYWEEACHWWTGKKLVRFAMLAKWTPFSYRVSISLANVVFLDTSSTTSGVSSATRPSLNFVPCWRRLQWMMECQEDPSRTIAESLTDYNHSLPSRDSLTGLYNGMTASSLCQQPPSSTNDMLTPLLGNMLAAWSCVASFYK